MKNKFKIGNRMVGEGYKPLVIAEIGINHNGSLKLAKKIVDAAKNAGAEIIKHQTHIPDEEMSSKAKKVIPVHTNESIYEIIKKCSLSEIDEIKLKKYTESKGLIFISTPFSKQAAIRLHKMNIQAFKIGSGECNNYPLIEHIANYKKPIILSTGMNSIKSIKPAVEILRQKKIKFALLHCTNIYPTPPELVRLQAMSELKKAFPDAVIGLSDHTTSNYTCLAAIGLGASIVERHFIDKKNRKGADIECSMNKKELKDLIIGSETIFKSLKGKKEIIKEEKITTDFAFSTVVTTKKILKGQKFSKNNIWLKRPNDGDFGPKDYKSLIGKISKINMDEGYKIKKKDIL